MNLFKSVAGIKGSGLKTRLLKFSDEYWELRLRVRTMGFEMPDSPDSRPNTASPYSQIATCLRRLHLREDDVFVDVGCGYGRPTLFAASRYHLVRAVGVDINTSAINKAKENARSLRKPLCEVNFYDLAAQDYDFSDATVVFMYNPFGEDTMRLVREKIHQSVKTHHKKIRIAYINPQYHQVFDEADWLERYDEWHPSPFKSLFVRKGSTTAVLWRSI